MADAILAMILCAAGLVFAAHFPCEQRRAGLCAATAIALDTALYLSAWTPWAPHMLIGCQATVIWSLSGLLAGAWIAECALAWWWGRTLVTLYGVTLASYALSAYGASFPVASMLTDYAGYIQIITLMMVGGRGVRNNLFDRIRRVRNAVEAHQTA